MEQTIVTTQENESGTDVVQLMKLCYRIFKANWYWFLLSVLVCLSVGFLYQQRKVRVYQRQAVMLIENAEGQGGGAIPTSRRGRNNMNQLLELNGISVGDNLENEMFILSSAMKTTLDGVMIS